MRIKPHALVLCINVLLDGMSHSTEGVSLANTSMIQELLVPIVLPKTIFYHVFDKLLGQVKCNDLDIIFQIIHDGCQTVDSYNRLRSVWDV